MRVGLDDSPAQVDKPRTNACFRERSLETSECKVPAFRRNSEHFLPGLDCIYCPTDLSLNVPEIQISDAQASVGAGAPRIQGDGLRIRDNRFVDSAGRVERFQQRYGSA